MDGDNRSDRVKEWEDGLPSVAELTPLSQCLISPQLASAFSITSDIPPYHILADVNKASQSIVAILRGSHTLENPSPNNPNNHPCNPRNPRNPSNPNPNPNPNSLSPNYPVVNPNFPKSRNPNPIHPVITSDAVNDDDDESRYPFDRGVHTRIDPGHGQDQDRDRDRDQDQDQDRDRDQYRDRDHDPQPEEVDSSVPEEPNPNEDSSARTLKRPRLVWTPELHKRFIEAVGHLGIHNAVPKTIMQLMNVEGLTRENVASHLQKYRLYLKRMQGLSSEGPSSSDYIFASAPIPPGYYAGMEDVVKASIKSLAPPPQGPIPMVRGGSNPTTPSIEPYPYNVFAPPPQRFLRPDHQPHHLHGTTRQQLQNPNPHHHVLRSFPTGK